MATRAELQKAVDDTIDAAKLARAEWKAFDPVDQANPTSEEQDKSDALERVYRDAKSARKNADKALAAFDAENTEVFSEPEPKPEPKPAPKPADKAGYASELDKKWAVYIAGDRALTDKAWADEIAGPRPAGWGE